MCCIMDKDRIPVQLEEIENKGGKHKNGTHTLDNDQTISYVSRLLNLRVL